MIKKVLVIILSLLIICVMAVMFHFVNQEEAQTAKQLATANEQIAPYQQKIMELREKIDRIKLGKDDGTTEPARVIYGFYADAPENISDEGAIILDADADAELKEAAKETGREVIYFFTPGKPVPQDGDAVVLRVVNDNEENRKQITGVISRLIDNAPVGPLGEDIINIPYIYNKTDDDEIFDILKSCSDALLVIFNPEIKANLEILKNCFENGTLMQSTVAETKQYLLENEILENERKAKNEEYILELEGQIDDLQQQIDRIYAQSKAARANTNRILGSIKR